MPQLFPFIMLAAVTVGAVLSRRYQSTLPLSPIQKVFIGLGGFSGAILTAKLPYVIPGLPGFTDASSLLISGKTILFGMAGGYGGVELAKWHLGLKLKTGDTFVVPVAAAIAIGRLACFCGGCCYGTPTNLPWAAIFPAVDQLARHPTQIYEFAFHLSAAIICARLIRRRMFRGQLIKLYFLTYFTYRFFTEFIRPEARIVGGITAYQWSVLVFIPLFIWLYIRDNKLLNGQLSKTPDKSDADLNQ